MYKVNVAGLDLIDPSLRYYLIKLDVKDGPISIKWSILYDELSYKF